MKIQKGLRIEKFMDPDEDPSTRVYYFRYVDSLKSHGGFNIDGDYINGSSSVRIDLYEFQVVRRTLKGAFIYTGAFEDKNGVKFIADYWVKKYAYPTIKEAQVSFLKRKMNQHSIYEARMHTAREAYQLGCQQFGMEDKIHKPSSMREVYDLIPRSMAQEMDDEIPL